MVYFRNLYDVTIFQPIHSQILHMILHLLIYNIKSAFEFVYVIFKQQKSGEFFFHQIVWGNGQTYFIFYYIYLKCLTLHTILDMVVSAETFNEYFIIEVNILRQQHEFVFKEKDFVCYKSQRIYYAIGSFFVSIRS